MGGGGGGGGGPKKMFVTLYLPIVLFITIWKRSTYSFTRAKNAIHSDV